jgi:hypothetical protein
VRWKCARGCFSGGRSKFLRIGLLSGLLRVLGELICFCFCYNKVTGYKGDVKELGQAEQYMREMAGFRGAPKRIRCMIYKQVRRHVCGVSGAIDKSSRFGWMCKWLTLI